MVINEAPDHQPERPKGFPVCQSFDVRVNEKNRIHYEKTKTGKYILLALFHKLF